MYYSVCTPINLSLYSHTRNMNSENKAHCLMNDMMTKMSFTSGEHIILFGLCEAAGKQMAFICSQF